MFGGYLPSGTFPRDLIIYWDGGPSDRINKTAYVSTSTTLGAKIHGATAVSFNGTTSKINCQTELVGTGDITFLTWFNATNFGEGGLGRIATNAKFVVRVNTTNDLIDVSSDGATFVDSANNIVIASTEIFIAVTRTSAGVVNIYKNGVLSGSANQASGTPAEGTTSLIIGNNSGGTATFNGTISHLRIFNKILTTTQIGQIYNREK